MNMSFDPRPIPKPDISQICEPSAVAVKDQYNAYRMESIDGKLVDVPLGTFDTVALAVERTHACGKLDTSFMLTVNVEHNGKPYGVCESEIAIVSPVTALLEVDGVEVPAA